MTAHALQHLLDQRDQARRGTRVCVPDPNGGWDYICTGGRGRALYDVDATRILATLVITIDGEPARRSNGA
jgi:hypothetical protein